MEKTLGYLRESLSNYIEKDELLYHLFQKLEKNKYETEEDFVKQLNTTEITHLNEIIQNEIQYAKEEQDDKRAQELNEVYELLY